MSGRAKITLKAHFDGKQIRLDEPFELQPHTPLLVVVGEQEQEDVEREDWYRLSAQGLEAAYGDDEPEYTEDMIKEPNPDYERR